MTYRATQADGSALPEWLAFNTETRTFSGTPPTTGRIEIRVTATDNAYPPYQASVTFSLTVRSPVTRPPVTRPPVAVAVVAVVAVAETGTATRRHGQPKFNSGSLPPGPRPPPGKSTPVAISTISASPCRTPAY